MYAIGCKEIRIGDKGVGGIMGTTLTAMQVYKNTVKLTEADPTVTPFFSENARFPDVVATENGAVNLNFEVHNVSKANLAAFLWVGLPTQRPKLGHLRMSILVPKSQSRFETRLERLGSLPQCTLQEKSTGRQTARTSCALL